MDLTCGRVARNCKNRVFRGQAESSHITRGGVVIHRLEGLGLVASSLP